MVRRNSIVARLVLVIGLSSALIYALTLGYNYYSSRALLRGELESNARSLALSLANRVETELEAVTRATEGTARALETGEYSDPALLALLRSTVEQNPEIYGSAVAFEPFAFHRDQRLYAPYFYREAAGIRFARLEANDPTLPYLNADWYQIPRELGRTEWSEPYYAAGAGNILMATCSVPLYDRVGGERRFRGAVTANVSLESLTRLVSSVHILKTGYAALLSRNGVLLAHPLRNSIMNESFFSIAEARNDAALRELGRRMIRGESGFVHYNSLVGVRSWMYYAPIRPAGWTLAVVFPEAEWLASVNRLTLTMLVIGIIGVLLLSAAVVSIATSITGPLRSLSRAAHQLSGGHFDAELPVIESRDEVGELASAFRSMQRSLREYIANLTETTAAKERIQSELKVATDIQASLLPRLFPPFPDRTEFDIFASMDPAKEVGGDFFDFFLVDPHRLCFLIADVADKGVPAALYMMVAKTLLKTEGQRLAEPSAILTSVNNLLAADNERCMFASVFCAILDVRTGEVRFANAGHNPPLVLGPDGPRYLQVRPGLMLGPMPGTQYVTESLQLAAGELLFLYTDGVTEAKNVAEDMYGEARLQDALGRVAGESPVLMIQRIRAEVKAFAGAAPQSDDVTMLTIQYQGPAAAPARAETP